MASSFCLRPTYCHSVAYNLNWAEGGVWPIYRFAHRRTSRIPSCRPNNLSSPTRISIIPSSHHPNSSPPTSPPALHRLNLRQRHLEPAILALELAPVHRLAVLGLDGAEGLAGLAADDVDVLRAQGLVERAVLLGLLAVGGEGVYV